VVLELFEMLDEVVAKFSTVGSLNVAARAWFDASLNIA